MIQIGTKFRNVFKLHTSDLHTKISHCIQYSFFYRALKKFQYITIFCLFLMTQSGTKFRYVLSYIDLIYIPKLVIVFSIYSFIEHLKN